MSDDKDYRSAAVKVQIIMYEDHQYTGDTVLEYETTTSIRWWESEASLSERDTLEYAAKTLLELSDQIRYRVAELDTRKRMAIPLGATDDDPAF